MTYTATWRVGKILTKAPGFGDDVWLEHMPRVTIRPDETVNDVLWQWARDNGYKVRDVKIEIVGHR
jgi:hypothetical protein